MRWRFKRANKQPDGVKLGDSGAERTQRGVHSQAESRREAHRGNENRQDHRSRPNKDRTRQARVSSCTAKDGESTAVEAVLGSSSGKLYSGLLQRSAATQLASTTDW